MKRAEEAQPSRVTILAGLPRVSLPLPEGELTVGRSPEAGLQLDHPSIELFHCRLKPAGKRRRVEPLASMSRTFLNGRVVKPGQVIKAGQVLSIGEVSLLTGEESGETLPLLCHGVRVSEISMEPGARSIGRHPECDILLPHDSIAPQQALIEGDSSVGYRISIAPGTAAIRINGLFAESRRMVFGDRIQIGAYHFLYDGVALRPRADDECLSIGTREVFVERLGKDLLHDVSLRLTQGEFVGIIGPTGAGKTTLLRVLAGLHRPDHGHVYVGGRDLYAQLSSLRREIGWVPQSEIVHRELTVAQALTFSARLRLPRHVPGAEIRRLIESVASDLGLENVLNSRIRDLSGGEARKTSVASELLARPSVLLLDEPTSGLDPGAEAKLMTHLRHLADEGCAVLCSTHVMKHLYLFDRAAVLADGRRVFEGNATDARNFFGSPDAEGIFSRLESRRAGDWEEAFAAEFPSRPKEPSAEVPIPATPRRANQLGVLLARQAAILFSDLRTPLILLGQPLLIGLLLAWIARGTADDSALKLFFIAISCLWFGCGNGAPEIVGERDIYLRERMAGLGRASYAAAKWFFGGTTTLLQTLLLFAVVKFLGEGFEGELGWQVAGLAAMSYLAAAIGLAISAVARTPMQAVLLVPVFLIPQILFSGFAIPAASMPEDVRKVASAMPAYQLQRVMDTSLIWQREIDSKLLENHMQAFRNINESFKLKLGETFSSWKPAENAAAVGAAWLAASAIVIFAASAARERT